MKKPLRYISPAAKIINNSLIDLPTPMNISLMWNFGSLLGMCLIMQIMTGLFLSMHYSPNIETAFNSVVNICRNVNYGWMMRTIHANGASVFFICLYMHIGRGLYYSSFKLVNTWIVGVMILFATMATAFLGYVLPWGQMSFWGATVITNLLSAIPYLGKDIVYWIWGSFSIDNPTLNRFYSMHFILPFIVSAMVMIHLLFLHQTGSNNPLGSNSNIDKVPFHPYFSFKDLVGFITTLMILMMITFFAPYFLNDPDNFSPANPLVTPTHIKPEWYFLFAYAILRSIPNKLGGVIALVMSIAILLIMPLLQTPLMKSMSFYPFSKILFWMMVTSIMLLTWIGARPVEDPYIIVGKILTTAYFMYYLILPMTIKFWEKKML